MRVASRIKVSTQGVESISVKSIHRRVKGFKDIFIKIQTGFDEDDFIQDVVTVIAYFKRYKKPRFVK